MYNFSFSFPHKWVNEAVTILIPSSSSFCVSTHLWIIFHVHSMWGISYRVNKAVCNGGMSKREKKNENILFRFFFSFSSIKHCGMCMRANNYIYVKQGKLFWYFKNSSRPTKSLATWKEFQQTCQNSSRRYEQKKTGKRERELVEKSDGNDWANERIEYNCICFECSIPIGMVLHFLLQYPLYNVVSLVYVSFFFLFNL